jgi:hypothetical protein
METQHTRLYGPIDNLTPFILFWNLITISPIYQYFISNLPNHFLINYVISLFINANVASTPYRPIPTNCTNACIKFIKEVFIT